MKRRLRVAAGAGLPEPCQNKRTQRLSGMSASRTRRMTQRWRCSKRFSTLKVLAQLPSLLAFAPRVSSAPLHACIHDATMSTAAPHIVMRLPPPCSALPSSSPSVSPPTTSPDSSNSPASSVIDVRNAKNQKTVSNNATVPNNAVPTMDGSAGEGGAAERATRPLPAIAVQRMATCFARTSLAPSVKAARAPAEPPTLQQRGL